LRRSGEGESERESTRGELGLCGATCGRPGGGWMEAEVGERFPQLRWGTLNTSVADSDSDRVGVDGGCRAISWKRHSITDG